MINLETLQMRYLGITYKDQIVEVVVSGGITSIPGGTFEDYTNLLKVTLSDKITALGSSAFRNCTSLKTINLPDNLRWISDGTFQNCRNLELTKLPSNLEGLGDSLGGCTFEKLHQDYFNFLTCIFKVGR